MSQGRYTNNPKTRLTWQNFNNPDESVVVAKSSKSSWPGTLKGSYFEIWKDSNHFKVVWIEGNEILVETSSVDTLREAKAWAQKLNDEGVDWFGDNNEEED